MAWLTGRKEWLCVNSTETLTSPPQRTCLLASLSGCQFGGGLCVFSAVQGTLSQVEGCLCLFGSGEHCRVRYLHSPAATPFAQDAAAVLHLLPWIPPHVCRHVRQRRHLLRRRDRHCDRHAAFPQVWRNIWGVCERLAREEVEG